MAQDFLVLSRHGTVFYFRRRVPDELRAIIGKPYLIKSLGTSQRGLALIMARAYAAKTDSIYQHLRAMKKSKPEGYQFDYTLELDLDDNGFLRKIKVDATPEESAAVEAAIEATLSNLPNQPAGMPISRASTPAITASELFEDFFREGIGVVRWKDAEITRQHDYAPVWAKFSVHAQKYGLTLEAVRQYRAEVLAQSAALNTKIRNLSLVHAVVLHGVEHHGLDGALLNSLKATKLKGKGKSKVSKTNSYLPFTEDELKRLFHSDAYRNNSFKKPSHYWLPLLGLYTGARLEELAGLHLTAFTSRDEIPAVLLSDEVTTDGGKNEFAPRYVPIHRELIDAGLLGYVEFLKQRGYQRLFPDIGAAARDGYGKRATVDFTEYRRSVGVGNGQGTRSRQTFHSFRSTLAVEFYHAGVDGDLSRRLTGHAAIDVHQGTYLGAASIPMVRASVAMNQISFKLVHPPFVDTPAYEKARSRVRRMR